MPGDFLHMDTGFPSFTGQESTEARLSAMQDYLFILLEQLRYTLFNLDPAVNLNAAAVERFTGAITEPVYARISDAEGHVSELALTAQGLASRISDTEGNLSALVQTVNGFTLTATNGNEASLLQLTSGDVLIASTTIRLLGMVTFSSLATPGATVIDGGNIQTGTISAINLIGNTIIGGTITGARLLSTSQYSEMIQIGDGQITIGQSAYGASLAFDGTKVYLSANLSPLKLSSLLNVSIDAGGSYTVFVGTSNAGENVSIGNAAGNIYLVGNVYVNGTPIESLGGGA